MPRTNTISVVLNDAEKSLILRLQSALEKRTGIAWPVTQIMRSAIKTLASKEKVK